MRSRLAAFAVLAAVAAAVPAFHSGGKADAARGFEVLAHVDTGHLYTGDVYGRGDHAYVSSYRGREACPAHGVRVFDLRDPRNPRAVSRFADGRSVPALAGAWTEKTIVKRVGTAAFKGELAVTSVQRCRDGGFQGFALFDVTNPARPKRLALVRTEPRGSHEIWLQARGNKAYVYTAIPASELRSAPDYDPARRTASRPGQADFRIFDVSNPRKPRHVGSWGAWRQLGVHPNAGRGDDAMRINLVHSVIGNEAGTRAYLSYWDLGTIILDVSNPARPRYVGRTKFAPGEDGNAHSAALANGGRVLVETRETNGGFPVLFDISRPSQPRRLAAIKLTEALLSQGRRERLATIAGLDLGDSVHDPKVLGKTVFFSWYRQGVVAADISDARRPRLVARFLPPPERDREKLFCPDQACTAFWGVFATDDYLLASDIIGGLWVLRLR